MKKFIAVSAVALALSLPSGARAAESYDLDPTHTNIVWHASHFGFSSPSGRFGIKEGTLAIDAEAPGNSSVNVVIDPANLVTGIEKFDAHLKSADFLDVAKFPEAAFRSTKVELAEGHNKAKVTGDLTLHGVTKPVVLDVSLNKQGAHPMTQKQALGFTATTTIKRSEFGIDKYVPGVSDEVELRIEAEASAK